MELEKKIVQKNEVAEYSIFGWEVEGDTPEGAVILKRDKEDAKVKKYFNLELRYDSIKAKIKKLEKPQKPANDGRLCSVGVCVLLCVFCLFVVGIFLLLYKPGMTKYNDDMKEYKKQLQAYEDQLEEIRMQVQYIM